MNQGLTWQWFGYLIDAIANAMLNVTQENIHNWFAHCCYCTS
jgi:hypothetical protein